MACNRFTLRIGAIVALLVGTAGIYGCGVLESVFGGHTNTNGARGTIGQERVSWKHFGRFGYWIGGTENDFKRVDIVPLLTGGQVCGSVDQDEAKPNCSEWAFNCFHRYPPGQCPLPSFADPPPATATATPGAGAGTDLDGKERDAQRHRRNQVLERLIAASNSSCREFEQNLTSFQSWSNFTFGTAALGAGAAGAIVSDAVAAKALAGTAGALAGTRAEFNNDVFAQQLFPVMSQAIDTSREKFLTKLRGSEVEQVGELTEAAVASPSREEKTFAPTPTLTPSPSATATPATSGVSTKSRVTGKESLDPTEYPVEAAIADAIYYNGLCSLNKGLQTIGRSLSNTKDVGMKQFLTELQEFKQIQQLMAAPISSPAPSATPTPSPANAGKKPAG